MTGPGSRSQQVATTRTSPRSLTPKPEVGAPNHLAQGRGKPESCTLRAGAKLSLPGLRAPSGGSGPHPAPGRGHLTGEAQARVPEDTPALGLQTPAAHPHVALCPQPGRLRPARALTIVAAAASPARAPLSPRGRGARYPGGSGGAGPRRRGRGARLPGALTGPRQSESCPHPTQIARLPQPPELGASRLSSLALARHAGHTSGGPICDTDTVEWALERRYRSFHEHLYPCQRWARC